MPIQLRPSLDNPFLLWIRSELSLRMAQNLPYIKYLPQTILIQHPVSDAATTQLQSFYPKAHIWAHFPLKNYLMRRLFNWRHRPLKRFDQNVTQPMDLIWACCEVLHQQDTTQEKIKKWSESIAQQGLLMMSYLGPDTAKEFRHLFPSQPVLVDMHDLGDLLVNQGFADPVMTMEYLTLEYDDPLALLTELTQLQIVPDLMQSRSEQDWLEAFNQLKPSGGPWQLTLEIVYGHAWMVPKKPRGISHIDASNIPVKKKYG